MTEIPYGYDFEGHIDGKKRRERKTHDKKPLLPKRPAFSELQENEIRKISREVYYQLVSEGKL